MNMHQIMFSNTYHLLLNYIKSFSRKKSFCSIVIRVIKLLSVYDDIICVNKTFFYLSKGSLECCVEQMDHGLRRWNYSYLGKVIVYCVTDILKLYILKQVQSSTSKCEN